MADDVNKDPNEPKFPNPFNKPPSTQTGIAGEMGTAKEVLQTKNNSPSLESALRSAKESSGKNATQVAEKIDPSDPYKNYTDHVAAPGFSVLPSDSETQRIRTENVRAKEREIAAPGFFTRAEADRIKVGLDPAKQAEVEAQVLETSPEDRDKLFVEITDRLKEFTSNPNFGRNEVRAQLQIVRDYLNETMQRMDRGF